MNPRCSEDAKRILAVASEVFLQAHFHIVSLLTQHRGSQTPKRNDFLLAELLSDDAAVQKSLQRADLERGHQAGSAAGPRVRLSVKPSV